MEFEKLLTQIGENELLDKQWAMPYNTKPIGNEKVNELY
jgi:hypothetical protein